MMNYHHEVSAPIRLTLHALRDSCTNTWPGCCVGPSMNYNSSRNLPDEVLSFVKSHPLVEDSIPPLGSSPWITRTLTRDQLTHLAVDTSCGIFGNETILFLGSNSGVVLKYRLNPNVDGTDVDHSEKSTLIEEIQTYPADRCGKRDEQPWILGLEVDKDSGSLLVAYTRCVVKVPLARCQRHNGCIKSCLDTRDPYCAWDPENNLCIFTPLRTWDHYEQDLDGVKSSQLEDCEGLITQSFMEDKSAEVSVNMLVVSTLSAFVVGAVLSGLGVCLFSTQQNTKFQQRQKDKDGSLILDHPLNSVNGNNDASHPGQNPFFSSFKQNGWNPRNSNEHIGIPPTPEQTPQMHKRMINSQAYIKNSLHDPSFSVVYSNVHHFASSNLPADGLCDSPVVQCLQKHVEDSYYTPLHYLPLKEDDLHYLSQHGEKNCHFHHYSNDSYCIPQQRKDSYSLPIPLEVNKCVPKHRSNPSYLSKHMQEHSAQREETFHQQFSQGHGTHYFSADLPFLWSSSEHRCVVSSPTSEIFCCNTHLKRNMTFGGDISSSFSKTTYMHSKPPHSMTTASSLK